MNTLAIAASFIQYQQLRDGSRGYKFENIRRFRMNDNVGFIITDLDMDAILNAAAETGVALEINAHPSRLDLDDVYARRAKELGIPISINTDAHSEEDFDMLFYGVATARRAWLTKKDVINAWPKKKLLDWLKKRS